MAWHLNQNLSTATLPNVSNQISKSALEPGDILNDASEHVVIFKSWADTAHTRINYYSFGSTPVKLRTNVSMTVGTIDSHPVGDYLARRLQGGLYRTVLTGDVMAKWPVGGQLD